MNCIEICFDRSRVFGSARGQFWPIAIDRPTRPYNIASTTVQQVICEYINVTTPKLSVRICNRGENLSAVFWLTINSLASAVFTVEVDLYNICAVVSLLCLYFVAAFPCLVGTLSSPTVADRHG
jgi:hypothetical protein